MNYLPASAALTQLIPTEYAGDLSYGVPWCRMPFSLNFL